MKKLFKPILLLGVFLIAFGVNNAFCDIKSDFKVAVVDFDAVAKNSGKFNSLKKYQAQKTKELQTLMIKAAQAAEEEKNPDKKKEIQEKYNKEYQAKKAEIEKHYAAEISAIDKEIEQKAQSKAKSLGYNLVLTRRAVLYGGEDITSTILNEVK